MGRRKVLLDGVKVTLNLNRPDYEAMKLLYPSATAAVAIRALVHQHVTTMQKRRSAETEQLISEIDLEMDE